MTLLSLAESRCERCDHRTERQELLRTAAIEAARRAVAGMLRDERAVHYGTAHWAILPGTGGRLSGAMQNLLAACRAERRSR